VPNIFQAMVASVLPGLTGGAPLVSHSLRVMRPEAALADPLAVLATAMPDLSFGSYPFIVDGAYGSNLVVRGTDPARVADGLARLRAAFPDGQ
jgi:molybdopterin-biosynthesis enzyme MoeA-like protein